MSHNPFAGRVPLNLRKSTDPSEIRRATSYRPGIAHHSEYRNPNQDTSLDRNEGCTPLRRYPNGVMDIPYVAQQIVDIVHKAENKGSLTSYEKAMLSLILPKEYQLIDSKLAATMARITDEEKLLVRVFIDRHFREEINYNAGQGGGSVPGRHQTRS
jgi:hypothetical protein